MEIKIFYFDIKHAIKLHDWIINNSGGLPGNREIGLLDSALQHIQNDMYYPTFEEKLKETIQHRVLNKKVSYKYLFRLECYKITKFILQIDPQYKPFKIWW